MPPKRTILHCPHPQHFQTNMRPTTPLPSSVLGLGAKPPTQHSEGVLSQLYHRASKTRYGKRSFPLLLFIWYLRF